MRTTEITNLKAGKSAVVKMNGGGQYGIWDGEQFRAKVTRIPERSDYPWRFESKDRQRARHFHTLIQAVRQGLTAV